MHFQIYFPSIKTAFQQLLHPAMISSYCFVFSTANLGRVCIAYQRVFRSIAVRYQVMGINNRVLYISYLLAVLYRDTYTPLIQPP